MAFSREIDLTVGEEFEQYVRVGFRSREHFREYLSGKTTEEKLMIVGEIATVGKGLVQSRIAGNLCRDAESGALASYLVRILDRVTVAARERPADLPELGHNLSEAHQEAENHHAQMEVKVNDFSTERKSSHCRNMASLAVAFFVLVLVTICLPEGGKHSEGKKVSVNSESQFSPLLAFIGHCCVAYIGHCCVVVGGFVVFLFRKVLSLEFVKAYLENFAPTVFSGCLHSVERSYKEKHTDAKEMLDSWSWMLKVALVTGDLITLSEPSSGPLPPPDGTHTAQTPSLQQGVPSSEGSESSVPPQGTPTAQASPLQQGVPSTEISTTPPAPLQQGTRTVARPGILDRTHRLSDKELNLPKQLKQSPFDNNTLTSISVHSARPRKNERPPSILILRLMIN